MPRLLSGRVGLTSASGLTTDRYSFIGLEQVEPNLGNPSNNNFVLYGDVEGTRYWGPTVPAGSVDGITVEKEGIAPVGLAGSITIINFLGAGISVTQSLRDVSGFNVGVATVAVSFPSERIFVNSIVNSTNNDKVIFPFGIGVTNGIQVVGIITANELRVAGVITANELRVAGVITASNFVGNGSSLTGVRGELTFQTPDGNIDISGVTTIRVGSGMTLASINSGIASIGIGTIFEGLVIGVTTISSSGSIKSQAFNNFLPQRITSPDSLNSQTISDYHGAIVVSDNGEIYRLGNGGSNSILHRVAEARHTGIITATGGFVATGSSVGFTGPLYSTGISTAAFLQATTVNVGSAATVTRRFNALEDVEISRNLIVSGVSTFNSRVNASGVIQTLWLSATGITGNIYSVGVSTISQLVSSTINSSGIITASGGFVGNLTGNITGNINSSGISTLETLQVSSINSASGISTIQQLKGDTISVTGIITASSFSGSISGTSSGLTGIPDIVVGFVTSKTILPSADSSFDLGAPLMRWNNIYSADMHFSNEGSSNSVDGTWGSWTLQEGENDLYMLNHRTGKRYKINLTEV
jgi:hypothetical protein